MNLIELKEHSISELVKLAASMKLDNLGRNRKQDIIFAILNAHA
jgi:transcription termination factor Rho